MSSLLNVSAVTLTVSSTVPFKSTLSYSKFPIQAGSKAAVPQRQLNCSFPSRNSTSKLGGFRVRAFIFNPNQDPLFKEALKEPVAFLGGMFAGFLRLDLTEDPLKEWVARTVEASAITEEGISDGEDAQAEEIPQQIEIE